MSTSLARVNDAPNAQVTQLAPMQSSGIAITAEKKELLKRTICKGATDDELELALAIAGRMGLDPFARQIAFIKRWDSREKREVMTAQPTIDGARLLAQRSANYGGQIGPFWCGKDGEWVDVWLSDDLPVAARVGVVNLSFKEPLFAVAKFSSYAAKNREGRLTPIWAQMPDLMIAKCAEMLALRRAFPAEFADFGGVDFGSTEDLGQMVTDAGQYIEVDGVVADSATGEIVQQDELKTQPTQADTIKRLMTVASNRGLTNDDVHALAWVAYRVDSLRALDIPALAKLAERVEQADMGILQAAIAQWQTAQQSGQTAEPPDEPTADAQANETSETSGDAPPVDESPLDEMIRLIRAANSADEYDRLAKRATDAGLWSQELTTAEVEKRQELGLPAPKSGKARTVSDIIGDVPVAVEGEPGNDRFSS